MFLFTQAKRTLKAQKLQEELASGKLVEQAVSNKMIIKKFQTHSKQKMKIDTKIHFISLQLEES